MIPPVLSELEDFITQQAAEDAFAVNGEREEREAIVSQLIREHEGITEEQAQELINKYIGFLALYRGEVNNSETQGAKVKVDLAKIGWLVDQTKNGSSLVELDGEHVDTPELSFDFIDLTPLDGVTKASHEKIGLRNMGTNWVDKLKKQEIPQLWRGIISGRGDQRPISAGNNSKARAGSSGRPLDTAYPGYKMYIHRRDIAAIVLVLGKNEKLEPQFGLAALYDQKDQEKIWSELMNRSSHGRH